jgi:hypothetical protein
LSKLSAREEEKLQRQAKKLAEKLRNLEDSCRNESERSRKHGEKREHKKSERLERAKRRVDQIRSIIGSIDPANLDYEVSGLATADQPSTSTAVTPSPELIHLLSTTIAGCLQPCTLINKVLNEIMTMIPQLNDIQQPQQSSADQQQQTEIPLQTTATNTSDVSSPVQEHQSNQEIEALFKAEKTQWKHPRRTQRVSRKLKKLLKILPTLQFPMQQSLMLMKIFR